ncbi:Arylsulfatase [Pontiella desulfatans]|uniref:Arylsulfatase n=1 Tax=Pontiella desulfatans TaxID=2750659 RepID=A0A6C2U8M5_PONDE|nr:sulfatase [Pontiella desulfatans]SPS74003.1 sulfatase S1_8 [Kiritimatiellales bacterium]VGO15756.1 Arylsulfatase [Pontiella desulfatans]
MKRILFTLICLLSASIAHANKPNIILFVTDDHGLDALGCYGNSVIQTPNMDKLAAEGVRFTQAYCTSASCAASRSVILTGKFGHATGSYGHVHDYHHFSTFDTVKSLPVMLEDAGYHTAQIGKYHVAPESVYRFNVRYKCDPRSTIEMAATCEPTLNQAKPFFLYFCPDDPHRGHPFTPDPWDAPNSFGNKTEPYPGETIVKYDPNDVLVPSFLPDTRECREEMAQYYQSVSRIDQGLGKLLELLAKAGKVENTIIIYISDNGIAFPGAKTTVYEPGIKLPCIVKDPRTDFKGTVNNSMVSWVDLAPTILDFAGIGYNKSDFHGRSFLPILGKENSRDWNTVYAAHNFHELTMYYPMRVVREGDLKLIWNMAFGLKYPFASDLWAASTWQSVYRNKGEYFGHRKVQDYLYRAEFELYDLKADPEESNNLATDPAHAKQLQAMKKKMQAFQTGTNDPWQIIWGNKSQMQGSGVNL